MLNIQRWKLYSEDDLRAEGLTAGEIRQIMQREEKPFRPAFKNGERVTHREGDGFYERMKELNSRLHESAVD
jgi:Zn-finger nucleic acid-binding protein